MAPSNIFAAETLRKVTLNRLITNQWLGITVQSFAIIGDSFSIHLNLYHSEEQIYFSKINLDITLTFLAWFCKWKKSTIFLFFTAAPLPEYYSQTRSGVCISFALWNKSYHRLSTKKLPVSLPLHINLSQELLLTVAPSVERYCYYKCNLLPKDSMLDWRGSYRLQNLAYWVPVVPVPRCYSVPVNNRILS